MKITVLGAGAMGSCIGALLHKAGNEVTFLDVSTSTIEAVTKNGLSIENKAGVRETLRISITSDASSLEPQDLIIVFVKCYHTQAAVNSVMNLIGPQTTVLSLQNGWGNGQRIAEVVGEEKVVVGVCYHSAVALAPGHVLHAGMGNTFMGELNGGSSQRLRTLSDTFNAAGIAVEASSNVFEEIWSKLALNVVTLPPSASTGITADQLMGSPEMEFLMKELLREVVEVANAQEIPISFDERWDAISGLLGKLAPGTKGSMLQDVENKRQTEIDVMCGAIIDAAQKLKINTPYNHAMIGLIKGLEKTFC